VSKTISLADIAKAAGVTRATVSLALSNKPVVAEKTRLKVHRIAEELGYIGNASLKEAMTTIRQSGNVRKFHQLAFLQITPELNEAYQETLINAQHKAREMGCEVKNFILQEYQDDQKHLERAFEEDGVTGVIVIGGGNTHLDINLQRYAFIKLTPGLEDQIQTYNVLVNRDNAINYFLENALTKGFEKIAICSMPWMKQAGVVEKTKTSTIAYRHRNDRQIKILNYHFKDTSEESLRHFALWMHQHDMQIILCFNDIVLEAIDRAGWNNPDDVSVAHINANLHKDQHFAGLDSRHAERAHIAVEHLILQLRRHEYGLPKSPYTIVLDHSWMDGKTLGEPRTTHLPEPKFIPETAPNNFG